MDGQELYNLYEAYLEVVSNNNELSEMSYKKLPVGKMMRKVEYRAEREADTRADAEREANDPHSILNYDRARREHKRAERNKERSNRMINVADTHSKKVAKAKSKLKKEQVDIYDIILSHLLDEGYAETPEAAEAMMVNMSEEWRDSIMEGYKRYPSKRVGEKLDRMYNDPNTNTRFGKTGKRYGKMMDVDSHMKGEVHPLRRTYSPKKSKAKEAENRARGK